MRTPRAQVGGQDSLMQQAANLAKLRDLQTPLLGGENPELAGLDYSGIVPQKGVVATPNPLAAAAAAAGVTPGPGYGATPSVRGAAGAGTAVGGLLGATPGRAGETCHSIFLNGHQLPFAVGCLRLLCWHMSFCWQAYSHTVIELSSNGHVRSCWH